MENTCRIKVTLQTMLQENAVRYAQPLEREKSPKVGPYNRHIIMEFDCYDSTNLLCRDGCWT